MRSHLRRRKALQLHRARHPWRGFESATYLKYLWRHRRVPHEIGRGEQFRFITTST